MRYDLSEVVEPHFVDSLNDIIIDRPADLYLVDTRGMSGAGFADFMRKLYKKGAKVAKDTVGFVKDHGAKAIKTYEDVSQLYDEVKPGVVGLHDLYNDNIKQYAPDSISTGIDKIATVATDTDRKLSGYRNRADDVIVDFNKGVAQAETLVGNGHPAQRLRKRLLQLEGKGIHTGGSKGGGLHTTGRGLYTTGSHRGCGLDITRSAVKHLQQNTGMTPAHAKDLFKRCQCGSGIGQTVSKQYLRPLRKISKRTPRTTKILKDLEKLIDMKYGMSGGKIKAKDVLSTAEKIGKIVTPFIPLLL